MDLNTERATAEVSAALAAVRRRERYMQQAGGSWSWSEALGLATGLGLAAYWIFKSAPDWPGDAVYGMVLFVAVIAGWQHRRLSARVDALTKLLAEMSYEGKA